MSSPIPLPAGLTLLPMDLPRNIPEMVRLIRRAYDSNRLDQVIFPSAQVDRSARLAWNIQRIEERLTKDSAVTARLRYSKVVKNAGAPDEQIVSAAGWFAPRVGKEDVKSEELKSEEEKEKEREEAAKGRLEGMNQELADQVVGLVDRLGEAILGKDRAERYWYLSMLATSPDYARQGLASALVRWGVQQAEAEFKENPEGLLEGAFLFATPDALPLYLRACFREVASVTHDLGNGEDYKHVMMVRKFK